MNFPAFLQVPRVEKALAFELGHRHVVPANKHPPVFEVSKEAIVFLVAAYVFFEVVAHNLSLLKQPARRACSTSQR